MAKKAGGVLLAVISFLFWLSSCGGADEPREAFIGRYEIDRLQIGGTFHSPKQAGEDIGTELGGMLLILVKDGTYYYRAGENEEIRRWHVERGQLFLNGRSVEHRGDEIVLPLDGGVTAYLRRVPGGDTVFPQNTQPQASAAGG